MTYKILSDNAPVSDHLQMAETGAVLAEVLSSVDTPFCVGIFGEWGSGKTTLMRFIEGEIDEAAEYCIWFNAWKYSEKEVIWNALSQTILFHIASRLDGRPESDEVLERIRRVAVNLAKLATKVGARFLPGDFVKSSDVDEFFSAFGPLSADKQEQFEVINFIEFQLAEIIESYCGGSRLIVFIDDLDRCIPENALEIMEAIKIFFGQSNIVFVLAIERAIIEDAISLRYGENSKLTAKEYLEKIVQLPFVLRAADGTITRRLMSTYEEQMPFLKEEVVFDLIQEATRSNPRRIKRFLNSLLVLWKMYDKPDRDEAKRLALILLLQLRWPDVFDLLAKDLSIVEDYLAIKNKEQEAIDSFVLKKPYFEKILRDRELRRFLDRARFFNCEERLLEKWIKIVAQ